MSLDKRDAGAAGLATLYVISGVSHFAFVRPYARIVPSGLGDPDAWVYATGLAKFALAALVTARRTRRTGGWLSFAFLLLVFPANVKAALDGGYVEDGGTVASTVAWIRLPFQLPLLWLSCRLARREPSRT